MPIFDQDFKAYVSGLKLVSPTRSGTVIQGVTPGMNSGESLDFHDYRPYVPGDDLRKIDWNIYRRSKKLFLRRFKHFSQIKYSILLDLSPSLYFEKERLYSALRICAAIGNTVLQQGDKLNIWFGSRGPVELKGGSLSIHSMFTKLNELANEAIDCNKRFFWRNLKCNDHTVAWLISDFFEPAGINKLANELKKNCGNYYPVRIFRETDESPDLRGSYKLVDCSTKKEIKVNITPAALATYEQRYLMFKTLLNDFAKRNSTFNYAINADQGWRQQLNNLFPGGIMTLCR